MLKFLLPGDMSSVFGSCSRSQIMKVASLEFPLKIGLKTMMRMVSWVVSVTVTTRLKMGTLGAHVSASLVEQISLCIHAGGKLVVIVWAHI